VIFVEEKYRKLAFTLLTAAIIGMFAWALDLFSVRTLQPGGYIALAGAALLGYWVCEYGIPEAGNRKEAYPLIAALFALAWLAVTVWLGAFGDLSHSFTTMLALFGLVGPVSFTVREYMAK
jgi:hypothetical protein